MSSTYTIRRKNAAAAACGERGKVKHYDEAESRSSSTENERNSMMDLMGPFDAGVRNTVSFIGESEFLCITRMSQQCCKCISTDY